METLTQQIDLNQLIDQIREAESQLSQCATERQKATSTLKALEVALADELVKLSRLGQTENSLAAFGSKARNEACKAALAGVTAATIGDMLEPLAMSQAVQLANGVVTELKDQAGARTFTLNREISVATMALADVQGYFAEVEAELEDLRARMRILRGS